MSSSARDAEARLVVVLALATAPEVVAAARALGCSVAVEEPAPPGIAVDARGRVWHHVRSGEALPTGAILDLVAGLVRHGEGAIEHMIGVR